MVKNLKALRESRKLSQAALAEAIGSTQQSINKYENHLIEPDIDTLIEIANFFGVSVDVLIGNENNYMSKLVDNLGEDGLSVMEDYAALNTYEKNAIKSTIDAFKKKDEEK